MSMNNTLYLDEVRLRNFLSYGNADTVVQLDKPGTTLIVGEDLDSGTGTSNGAGKSTILNAIVYALFDKPLSKDIKLDDLINNVNKKNLEVAIKFHKGLHTYEIIRQRKGKDGTTVKLYIDGALKTLDSIDQTNKFIEEKIIGYSYDLFVRIVVFSANHDPFFSLPTSGTAKLSQTDIIEELFSLTALTLKANQAKADIKENEQRIELIKAKLEQIEKEHVRHEGQIASVSGRLSGWDLLHDSKLEKVTADLERMNSINIPFEIRSHAKLGKLDARLKSITSLKKLAIDWQTSQDSKLVTAMKERNKLKGIDFDKEQQLHDQLNEALARVKPLREAVDQAEDWNAVHAKKLQTLQKELTELSAIDFDKEFKDHEQLVELSAALVTSRNEAKEYARELTQLLAEMEAITKELSQLADAKCPYCKQDFAHAHTKVDELKAKLAPLEDKIVKVRSSGYNAEMSGDETIHLINTIKETLSTPSVTVLNKLHTANTTVKNRIKDAADESNPHHSTISSFCKDGALSDVYAYASTEIERLETLIGDIEGMVVTASVSDVSRKRSEFDSASKRIAELSNETNPHTPALEEAIDKVVGDIAIDAACADIVTAIQGEVLDIREKLETKTAEEANRLEQELAHAQERHADLVAEINPFIAPLAELRAMDLDEAEFDAINQLQKVVDHQKFLVKLLTKSDSFVRKALIDKNIPFLNGQLKKYLTQLGLPHKVEFTNTMTASISQMGRPLSYNNLSTGQKARVNLALSWAFRDVLQRMHSPVNFCLLDEVLDVGLCAYGISAAAKMLKAKAKAENLTMFIISHRDELDSTFDRNMKVVLQKGFSRIES